MRHEIITLPQTGVELETYLTDNRAVEPGRRKPLVLVFPGGAYMYRSDREAEPVALRLQSLGIQAVIVRYSVAPAARYPKALEEAAEAVAYARAHAEEWLCDPDRIADAIWRKKPPGIGTYGTVSRSVTDERGNTHTVRFSRPVPVGIGFRAALRSYDGFDEAAVTAAIKETLFNYANALEIGAPINVPQLYGRIYQAVGSYASTFAITDLACTGAHGAEREKLVPEWNTKLTVPSLNDVAVIVD